MDTWEQLNEAREKAIEELTDGFNDLSLKRAEVLAILYVGDCIRALGNLVLR